jgi:hypothetical protein
MRPCHANPEEHDQRLHRLPPRIHVTGCLGSLDGAQFTAGNVVTAGLGFIEQNALQLGPGHHAWVLGALTGKIEDVANEFGYRIGPQRQGVKELGSVGGRSASPADTNTQSSKKYRGDGSPATSLRISSAAGTRR